MRMFKYRSRGPGGSSPATRREAGRHRPRARSGSGGLPACRPGRLEIASSASFIRRSLVQRAERCGSEPAHLTRTNADPSAVKVSAQGDSGRACRRTRSPRRPVASRPVAATASSSASGDPETSRVRSKSFSSRSLGSRDRSAPSSTDSRRRSSQRSTRHEPGERESRQKSRRHEPDDALADHQHPLSHQRPSVMNQTHGGLERWEGAPRIRTASPRE